MPHDTRPLADRIRDHDTGFRELLKTYLRWATDKWDNRPGTLFRSLRSVGWLVPVGDVKRCLIAETVAWPCTPARPRHSFGDHEGGSLPAVLPENRAVDVGQPRVLNNAPVWDNWDNRRR